MGDSRDHRLPDDSMVDWTREAEFEFADEVDALVTLQELGGELHGAREQVRQIMRYLQTAVVAAHQQVGATPTRIIGDTGLARQTVYTMLGKDSDQERSPGD